jgi:hypothetical protein
MVPVFQNDQTNEQDLRLPKVCEVCDQEATNTCTIREDFGLFDRVTGEHIGERPDDELDDGSDDVYDLSGSVPDGASDLYAEFEEQWWAEYCAKGLDKEGA